MRNAIFNPFYIQYVKGNFFSTTVDFVCAKESSKTV